MDENKNLGMDSGTENERPADQAPRARNRTVMLTPDVTGEVRARLAQELGQTPGMPASRSAYEPPPSVTGFHSGSEGFAPPRRELPGAPITHQPPQHVAPLQAQQGSFKEGSVWVKETPLVGFLVSYDNNPNGEFFLLRSGRMIVTSERVVSGNYLLIDDESVSSMHAIMRICEGGEILFMYHLS